MSANTLESYARLVAFLGKVLSPDYEIALHRIDTENKAIMAIANGHVSGRTVGAPITDLALKLIKSREYESKDYVLNYKGLSKDGKILRSSTFFIKDDDNRLIGLLCINFDDSRAVDISQQIMSLCMPGADRSVENHELSNINQDFPLANVIVDPVENFSHSISEMVESVIKNCLPDPNIPVSRLTQDEKSHIVDVLNQKGIFMLKGAVSQVARSLSCSEPTVYRYLNMLNSEKES